MLTRLLTALLAAALLLLPACGDDDNGEPSASSSEPAADDDADDTEDGDSPDTTEGDEDSEPAPTTDPPGTGPVDTDGDVDTEGDQAAADAAAAALSAFLEEEGFVADPPSDDAEDDMDDAFDFESEECAELEGAFPDDDEGLPGETAEAEIATFELEEAGQFASAEASMGLTGRAEDLDEVFELAADERMADCLAEVFQAEADDSDGSFVIEDLEVEASEVDGLGDDNVRFLITYDFTQEGTDPFPVMAEMVLARADRIGAMTMIVGFGADELPVSATEMAGLLLEAAADELG
jgi:hypothetical protein